MKKSLINKIGRDADESKSCRLKTSSTSNNRSLISTKLDITNN